VFKYLKTKQFIQIFIMSMLTIFFGTFIVGSYKSYGEQYIHDESFLAFTGAVASVFACLRFIWSFLLDKYSFKAVYGTMVVIQTVLALTFPLITAMHSPSKKYLFMLWVALSFWTEGGHFTVIPAVYKKMFGDQGSRVFGFGFSFIGIASLVKIVSLELWLNKIGFEGFLLVYAIFCMVSLAILQLSFEEKKYTGEEDE
jgi:hypothetical protein